MLKEIKKQFAVMQRRIEKSSDQLIRAAAARVRQLRRELDKLARRLDVMGKRPTA